MKQETIEILKERAEDLEIFADNQEEDLKEFRSKLNGDSIKLGKLYLKCYTILKQNINKFKSKEEGEDKEFNEFKEYFEKLEMNEEFENNLEYYNSNKFGSYWKGENISDYVKSKRKDINNFIDLFFEIFIQEI